MAIIKSTLAIGAVFLLLHLSETRIMQSLYVALMVIMTVSLFGRITHGILTHHYLSLYHDIERILHASLDTSSTIRLLADAVLGLTTILIAMSILLQEVKLHPPYLRAMMTAIVLTICYDILAFVASQMLDYHYLPFLIKPYVYGVIYSTMGLGMLLSGFLLLRKQKDSIAAVPYTIPHTITIDDTAPTDSLPMSAVVVMEEPQSPSESQ